MMLAAPPRATAGSLATNMTRTIAANVSVSLNLSVSFISRLPSCNSRSSALRLMGTMNGAHKPANANQGDPRD